MSSMSEYIDMLEYLGIVKPLKVTCKNITKESEDYINNYLKEKREEVEKINGLRDTYKRKMGYMEEDEPDKINPDHYKLGGIETYDFIAAKLSKEELKGYLKGNILKYITRESEKNGLEDIKKMQWYVNKLVELGD